MSEPFMPAPNSGLVKPRPSTSTRPFFARLVGNIIFQKTLMVITGLVLLWTAAVILGGRIVQSRTVEIGQPQGGGLVELRNGDKLKLSLAGNPTTGYNWTVVEISNGILVQSGDPEYQASSTMIGAGGTIILNFTAIGTGHTHLKLAYQRSFEKDVAPLSTYEVNVEIE